MAYDDRTPLYRKEAMFNKKQEPTKLDLAIDEVLSDMAGFTSDADEYAAMTEQLERLYRIRNESKTKRVSPDTWAIVGANLLGILVIAGFEQKHVIGAKLATSFLFKLPRL